MRYSRATRGLVIIAVTILSAACSDSSDSGFSYPAVDTSSVVRHDIPTGNGEPQATAGDTLAPDYEEREYLMEGIASIYSGPPTGPVSVEANDVPYVTRILVRYPKEPGRFSGRVLLEPFNTSSFYDRGVVWAQAAPLIQSGGDAWVGVTVRISSRADLQETDPARYGALIISNNDVEWDMLRQIGAVVKQGGPQSPLPDHRPDHLYMVGYSQSGLDTATFAMAFATRTGTASGAPVFDGFLPAAHSGSVTAISSGVSILATFEHYAMSPVPVPVIDLETQSDVEGFRVSEYTSPSGAAVRRPDSDTSGDLYRLYEIAGAAHAQRNPVCEGNGTSFPTYRFVRAALVLLYDWAEKGISPPRADRIEAEVIDTVSVMRTDTDGNAIGGIRSPFIDVPLSRLLASSTPGPFCAFTGDEIPFTAQELGDRYGDIDGFMKRFTESLDTTIDAGFLLEADRVDILREREELARNLFE